MVDKKKGLSEEVVSTGVQMSLWCWSEWRDDTPGVSACLFIDDALAVHRRDAALKSSLSLEDLVAQLIESRGNDKFKRYERGVIEEIRGAVDRGIGRFSEWEEIDEDPHLGT